MLEGWGRIESMMSVFFKVTHFPYEKAEFHGRRITDILSIALVNLKMK